MLPTNRTVEKLQMQVQQMDSAVKTSFSNLKRDLASQAETIEELQSRLADQEKISTQLAARIEKIKDSKQSTKSKECNQLVTRKDNTSLSSLHFNILKRLMLIQVESGRRSISMRDLASELYPKKPYDSIKSTLSKYIEALHRNGFVEKLRGYRLYLSYTESALQYADNERLNRMKELITR